MKQQDHVAQKVIRTERNLLEIRSLRGITLVYITRLEGTELVISLKFGQQIGLTHRLFAIKLECPHITVARFIKHQLER